MPGGRSSSNPEVTAWLDGLADDEFGHVERYIDLLAHQGALLGEPFTRQLDGKLREFAATSGRQQTRITYCIATGRDYRAAHRVHQDRAEGTNRDRPRPRRAMQRCVDEGHIAIEEGSSP